MGGKIHKCAGANDICSGRAVSVEKIDAAPDTQATTFTPAMANPLAERLIGLHNRIEEADHWSPIQRDVAAYIDSLEQELLHSCEDMPERLGSKYKWAAPIKDRPSNSTTLVWWLLAIAVGSFCELASILLKALD